MTERKDTTKRTNKDKIRDQKKGGTKRGKDRWHRQKEIKRQIERKDRTG